MGPSSQEPVLSTPLILFTPVAEENSGDEGQQFVDKVQNEIVRQPTLNSIVSGSVEHNLNEPLPAFLPWVGGKSIWELGGQMFKEGNGQARPFQWDAGKGDFNGRPLDQLWAAHSSDFEAAGFSEGGAYDRPARLQSWAATRNGLAFVTGLLFNQFLDDYQPHLRGASEDELAQAFSLYYRAGREVFDRLYARKLHRLFTQDHSQGTDAATIAKAARQVIDHPAAMTITPSMRPQGAIPGWQGKYLQLRSLLGRTPMQ